MEELKLHIHLLMLWEFNNSKNITGPAKKFSSFMNTVSLLTDFQSFMQAIRHWERNPNQDAPSDLDQDVLSVLVGCNPSKSTRPQHISIHNLSAFEKD